MTVTKYHRLGGLNNIYLSQFKRLGNPMSSVPQDFVLGEGLLPRLQTAAFLLYPHMAKRGGPRLGIIEVVIPLMGSPLSSKPNQFPKAPFLIPSYLGLEFGRVGVGDKNHSAQNTQFEGFISTCHPDTSTRTWWTIKTQCNVNQILFFFLFAFLPYSILGSMISDWH